MQPKDSILHTTYRRFVAIWQKTSLKRRFFIYLSAYTMFFLIAFMITFSPFLLGEKTFIWQSDGRAQHFPYIVYIGRALRRTLLALLDGETSIPLFDLSIGLGDDVIGFLSSQGYTDPLVMISAFVPARFSEYLYAFLAIFRIYLAGLSFSYLCFSFQKKALCTLSGSMVYCFCGYAIWCSMRHPYFINPMILLPLLIVGAEKILKKKKPYLFIFTIAYTCLCGFYHLYMLTVMLAVYALIRFFDLYSKDHRGKAFVLVLRRGATGYLLGIGLSAIILLPAIMEFLNASRSDYSNYKGAYAWTYYPTRLARLIAPPGSWDDMAFAAIVLLAVVLLFFSKGHRTLKILMSVALAVYMTSIGGLIMNGFQYASNRWTFGLALIAAFCVVEMLPELIQLSHRQKLICITVVIIYTTVCFSTELTRKLKYMPVGVIFLLLTLLVLTLNFGSPKMEIAVQQRRKDNEYTASGTAFREVVCLLLVVANVGVNGIYKFAPDQGNYSSEFKEIGYETARLEGAPERELETELLGNPTGRGDGTEFSLNTGMVWHIPGMLTYSSTANRNVTEFWEAIEICGNPQTFKIITTDQRTIVNTLLSGKYQVESEKKKAYIPYGYMPIDEKNGRAIYENTYALPWGYTYDRTMSYEELESLNGLETQEAMLQAIALEQNSGVNTSQKNISFDAEKLPYSIICKGCEWEDGKLVISKANATITLQFNMPTEVEGYVRLRGFDINGSGLSSFNLQVKCGEITKRCPVESNQYTWYFGRENYMFNLGYSEAKRDSLTITFPNKGVFRLQDIELYALPMENYPTRVEALREEPLENIQWDTNCLSGTVDLSKDKILCVSVPYSNGWSATVDGEKVEILRGNYMFMAIPLKTGHHEICFKYCSPGIRLGAVISVLSACIIAGMLFYDRKRNKLG